MTWNFAIQCANDCHNSITPANATAANRTNANQFRPLKSRIVNRPLAIIRRIPPLQNRHWHFGSDASGCGLALLKIFCGLVDAFENGGAVACNFRLAAKVHLSPPCRTHLHRQGDILLNRPAIATVTPHRYKSTTVKGDVVRGVTLPTAEPFLVVIPKRVGRNQNGRAKLFRSCENWTPTTFNADSDFHFASSRKIRKRSARDCGVMRPPLTQFLHAKPLQRAGF